MTLASKCLNSNGISNFTDCVHVMHFKDSMPKRSITQENRTNKLHVILITFIYIHFVGSHRRIPNLHHIDERIPMFTHTEVYSLPSADSETIQTLRL